MGFYMTRQRQKKIITFYDWINCLNCRRKDLYRTKNNRFFVAASSGKSINPIDESEVKKILSQYPDEYQEIFGKVDEA